MNDRFGKMPEETENLFKILELKIEALSKNVIEIKEENEGYLIKFDENKVEIGYINMILLKGIAKYKQREKAMFVDKNKISIFELLKD